MEALSWQSPEESTDAYFLLWSGPLVQKREGAIRIEVSGRTTALMLNGKLEMPIREGTQSVDLFVPRGVHKLNILTIATPEAKSVEAKLARENRQSSIVKMRPFTALILIRIPLLTFLILNQFLLLKSLKKKTTGPFQCPLAS